MLLLPVFAEPYVTPRVRLMIALSVSVVVTPLVSESLPTIPESPFLLFLLIFGEFIIGLFIGALARFLMSSLQIGGMIIAYQSGLANAFVLDATSQSQGALFGAFLTILGIMAIFATDLHYLFLSGLVDSYNVMVPGAPPPAGDMANLASRVTSDSFHLAMKISSPFLLIGLLFYLGLGLLGRLMPQVQVFFIALPLQVLAGLIVFALSLSAGILVFLTSYEEYFLNLLAPG